MATNRGPGTHFQGGLRTPTVTVADATTYTIDPKSSGKVHLIPDLTADMTITLPAIEGTDGFSVELMYVGAAVEAQDWIINTAETTSLYTGGVTFLDTANAISAVYADATDDDTLTVLTPEAGTRIQLVSDGVSWNVSGYVTSASAPTFA